VVPGEDYAAGIIDAISRCRIVVVVFSAHCNVSDDVKNEVAEAASRQIVIIPIRIEDAEPAGALRYHLLRKHWLNAFTPPLESHLKKLSEVVERNIAAKKGPVLGPEPKPSPEPVHPPPEPVTAPTGPAPKPQAEPVPAPPEQVLARATPASEEQPVLPGAEQVPDTEKKPSLWKMVCSWPYGLIPAGLALVIVLVVITRPPWPDMNQRLVQAADKGDLQQVQSLLDNGANVNAKDDHGSTALMLASSTGNLEVVSLLLQKEANVNSKREDGSTALTMAGYHCQSEVVKLLLARGADVNARVNEGSTALLFAAAPRGPADSPGSMRCLETVSLLLAKGVDVNDAKNLLGRTPLIAAAAQGNLEIVKLLLDKGANTDARDKEGKTALTHASEQRHGQVINLLKKMTADLAELKTLSKKYHGFYVASDKDNMMDFYDFPIKYYDRGDRDKASIDSGWDTYFARWTARDSEIKSIEIQSYSLDGGEATVRLAYSYRWTELSGRDVTGSATCFITWKKIKDKWKIKGLDEKKGAEAPHLVNSPWHRAVVTDSDGFACMRAGKGANSECLVQVPDGEPILAEKSDEKWLRVRTADGQTGFMHSSRLKMISD